MKFHEILVRIIDPLRGETVSQMRWLRRTMGQYIDVLTFSSLHDDVIICKIFPRLLTICAGNSPVTGEFPAQRPVTRSFDVFFDQRLNKRLSKQ